MGLQHHCPVRNSGRRIAAFLAAVLMSMLAASASAADTKTPDGAVVLTVACNMANTNRPSYDEKRDVFLKYHERAFDKAFAFDRAMLEGLGVTEIRIAYQGWAGPMTFSGPRLADVLKAAGCRGGPLVTLTLDGFGTEISAATVKGHDWVLATRTDGRPLGIGGRGPLWLVFDPPGDRPATGEEEGMWPWALFFIQCE